jgi:rhodanese-related sulfurtransferase
MSEGLYIASTDSQSGKLVVENVEDTVNIPLDQLRARLDELPKDETINVVCRSGQRAYYATRMLLQHGFKACTVSGACCRERMRRFFCVRSR